MLSKKQKDWLNSLGTDKKITIVPYDPTSEEKFLKIKAKIQKHLGKSIKVEHKGASSLGISGQDEIDVYIPVPPSKFNSFIPKMVKIFGEPRSLYEMDRARFHEKVGGKKIDLFLINEESESWIKGVKFENYLKSHPKILEKYKNLKEEGNGMTIKEYYTRKNIFINKYIH